MSFRVYFSFSTGLARDLTVPAGTKARMLDHVCEVEVALGLKRTRYQDNPVYWDYRDRFAGVDDETLCETVQHHNAVVRQFYDDLNGWSKEPPAEGETMTPADAAEFWHGLALLTVPVGRWTAEHYRNRMEHLYEVMRGREHEGVSFDTRALTPKQAAAVIRIFEFLDPDDLRLDVPHGRDHLASCYDGGYEWCGKCVRPIDDQGRWECRRRKCPLADDDTDDE